MAGKAEVERAGPRRQLEGLKGRRTQTGAGRRGGPHLQVASDRPPPNRASHGLQSLHTPPPNKAHRARAPVVTKQPAASLAISPVLAFPATRTSSRLLISRLRLLCRRGSRLRRLTGSINATSTPAHLQLRPRTNDACAGL